MGRYIQGLSFPASPSLSLRLASQAKLRVTHDIKDEKRLLAHLSASPPRSDSLSRQKIIANVPPPTRLPRLLTADVPRPLASGLATFDAGQVRGGGEVPARLERGARTIHTGA